MRRFARKGLRLMPFIWRERPMIYRELSNTLEFGGSIDRAFGAEEARRKHASGAGPLWTEVRRHQTPQKRK